MWILPSQLSKCAPDMAALDLESKISLASDCEPSHIVSLRGSLKPISSVKWKKDSWMQHLFGAILKPSHTNLFTDLWISSLRDTLASRLVPLENEQEKKTQDICGLGLQTEFDFFSQQCASLKMSKDISRWDSPQSSAIWKNWVTKCRGEYSVRRNASMQVDAQHRTNASGSSSWPTARTSDSSACRPNDGKDRIGKNGQRFGINLSDKVIAEQNWPTATSRDWKGPQGRAYKGVSMDLPAMVQRNGPAAPVNSNTHGNRQESWATPNTLDSLPSRSYEAMKRQATIGGRKNRSKPGNLREQIDPLMCQAYKEAQMEANQKQWATPIMGDSHLASTPEVAQKRIEEGKVTLSRQIAAQWATPRSCSAMAATITPESANDPRRFPNLETQVGMNWATPNVFAFQPPENTEQWTKRAEYQQTEKGVNLRKPIQSQVLHENEKEMGAMPPSAAKLNARWVEMLMGLNLGWTCPSCPASVIKNWPRFVSGWLKLNHAQMNSDCSVTELCQPPQPELF